MRREGSALHGLGVVTLKELADHFTSARVIVLQMLVVLIAVATIYVATEQIKDTTAEDQFLFLKLFTTSREPLPSFVAFLSFLVPLIAIGLGFDAVNGQVEVPAGGHEKSALLASGSPHPSLKHPPGVSPGR